MKTIDMLICCPAHYVTGGTELLHQFCAEMDKKDEITSRILYRGANNDFPCPEEYEEYNCEYVTEMPEDYDGVIVFPEIWANDVCSDKYKNCTKIIYWESWDNYFSHTPKNEHFKFLSEQNVIHLAQSAYAYEMLRYCGVKPLVVEDYIHRDFFEPFTEKKREDIVLYNPKKGFWFTEKIIKAMPDVIFVPIADMSRQEVIEIMHRGKLYIDFGDHPGNDRLPREAIACGLNVIVGAVGDALYGYTFLKHEKFPREERSIPMIARAIRHHLDNYEDYENQRIAQWHIVAFEKLDFQDQCQNLYKCLKEIEK